ncbi:MAG TPA: hypothetical protein VFO52_06700 [Longimicrobiales bacterium]|nr:hypothetical protein [Longimicrobiales bacterium]
MSNCPGADALVTIAGALAWDVDEGIRHLTSCVQCRNQLQLLASVHGTYDGYDDLSEQALAQITLTLSAEAEREAHRGRRARAVGDVAEALLAGGTAVAVVSASGLAVSGTLGAGLFVVVATSLFGYRVMRSSHATAAPNSSPSIQ